MAGRLLACDLNDDPCEQQPDYSEIYNQGYNDGLTCAGYNNPHSDQGDSDAQDTGSVVDQDLTEEKSMPVWSAYDQGFTAGRAGADCSAGFD